MRSLVNVTRGRVLAAHAQFAGDSHARRRGLLGRDSCDGALILAPCWAVHTWFMRFAIDVLFVDRHGRILDAREHVAPWRFAVRPGAFAVVEVAAGTVRSSGTCCGDHLEYGGRSFSAAFRTS